MCLVVYFLSLLCPSDSSILNECVLFSVPSPTDVMDALCDSYVDPSSGSNPCKRIQEDPRCEVDGMPSLHSALSQALCFSGDCPDRQKVEQMVCECSCWSQIVDVYTPMFQQWEHYDPEVADKLHILQTMCTKNVTGSLQPNIEESNSAQCGRNTLTIRMTPTRMVPKGTVVTVSGLNGDIPDDGLMVMSPNAELDHEELEFSPAQCAEWCSSVGLCPSTGSAVSSACKALPTEATGVVTGQRCMRWCNTNAELKIVIDEDIETPFEVSITMLNPTFSQQAPVVYVSASGMGFYMAPARPTGEQEVLSAYQSPMFTSVVISELSSDQGEWDAEAEVWRGNFAGMRNTVTLSITPNIELLPGAKITISGLTRSGDRVWPAPMVRSVANSFSSLAVDDWESTRGVLVLRVTDGGEIMRVGVPNVISLDLDMPPYADDNPMPRTVRLEASRAGSRLTCFVQPYIANANILNPRRESRIGFKSTRISAATCNPGKCNEMEISFSFNQVLTDDNDASFYIFGFMEDGLLAMERDSECLDLSTCNSDDATILPLEDADEGQCSHVSACLWNESLLTFGCT